MTRLTVRQELEVVKQLLEKSFYARPSDNRIAESYGRISRLLRDLPVDILDSTPVTGGNGVALAEPVEQGTSESNQE